MAGLIIVAILFGGGFTFVILRISISSMFWFSKKPNDKQYVFKNQFPYYIIVLTTILTAILISSGFAYFAMYYVLGVYCLALLIWNFKLKHCKKTYNNTTHLTEQHQPKLP
ncbi:hypothetical protein [uncultured Winogradskyella sp.]|uniref:hypothetical protein n=1 Tax=Winogradskyella sp. 4-2091 TaxID=3381659 RepID=UPI002610AFAC|nr:hypothetical protein [uncultured Winogradskyella sp.]